MQTAQLASLKPSCYGLLVLQARCRHMVRGSRCMRILECELLEMFLATSGTAVCQSVGV